MSEKTETIIGLRVKAITEVVFILDERWYKASNSDLRIDFQHRLNVDVDKNVIDFTLRTFYHYANESDILIDFQIVNLFEASDLKRLINTDGHLAIPNQMLITIVGLAISHSRALLARKLAGTLCEGLLISIVNPLEITKAFFPSAFSEEISAEKEAVKPKVKRKRKKENNI